MSPSLLPARLLAPCLALLCFAKAACAAELSHIDEIRRLTPAEAGEGRRVHLRAAITYFNPARRGDLAVQDSTGGIFVGRIDDSGQFESGDEVDIEGFTYWEAFMPTIEATTIRVIGHGNLPQPRTVTYSEVMSGNEIGQWVRITGIVRDAHVDLSQTPPRLLLEAASSGAHFRAWMLDLEAGDPERFVDAEVTFTGVPAALSNNDGKIFNFRLLMSRRTDIAIEKSAPAEPYSAAPLPLQDLRQCRPDNVVDHRVHVKGTVSGWQPGQWLALADGVGALQMRTEQTAPALHPGDKVDALGFPARGEYGVILEDAVFKIDGEPQPAPAPVLVTPTEALKFDSRLISVDATLLGMVRRADAFLLTLQAGGMLFETNLAWTSPAAPWPALQPGCVVRVTGICTVSAGDDIRYLRDLNPQSFRVALRDRADMRILQRAPWLNRARAEIIMGALGVASLLLLRHYQSLRVQIVARMGAERELKKAHGELEMRVEERSRQIEKEISARREAEGALRERSRLAAEIHDSLQQGLTALAAQLAITGETFSTQPATARAAIHQARALVRHTQEEIRRTVLNLRSQILERHALDGALAEMGQALLADQHIAFKVASEGEALDLPELVQDHLLRIGQEAMTNALKHGHPTKIDVRLAFRSRSVSLSVSDDGCGFCADSAPAQESGHFGLVGMRERVLRLGGTLVLDSTPGGGTKISAIIPLEAQIMRD